MWWIAFQVVEGIFAVVGVIFIILLIFTTSRSHCKGLSFTHKKEYILIWKPVVHPKCGCEGEHKYRVRWVCHGCDIMKEEPLCNDGAWKIENGKLVPDLAAFSKVYD